MFLGSPNIRAFTTVTSEVRVSLESFPADSNPCQNNKNLEETNNKRYIYQMYRININVPAFRYRSEKRRLTSSN